MPVLIPGTTPAGEIKAGSVGIARDGKAVEVGRFTVFSFAPFTAKDARRMRAFRFNARAALRALANAKELTERVTLHAIGTDAAMSGAILTLDEAEFSTPFLVNRISVGRVRQRRATAEIACAAYAPVRPISAQSDHR